LSWRDNLEPASFRGVPFSIISSETVIGRRTKTHNYYKRETPYVQDLGAAPDDFLLEGFVVQNSSNNFDYMENRDTLIAALKEANDGLLVHPYYGEINVKLVEPAHITETIEEGGIARFSMHFTRTGKRLLDLKRDYSTFIDNLIELLRAQGLDGFFDTFESVSEIVDDIDTTLTNIVSVINDIRNGISSAIATATGQIASILTSLDTIIDSPCDVGAALLAGADAVLTVVGMGDEVLTGGVVGQCSGLTEEQKNPTTLVGEDTELILDGETIPENLGISTIQSLVSATTITTDDLSVTASTEHGESQIATLNLTKLGLFGNLARIAIRTDFSSQDRLIENTNLIAAAIDEFMLELGDTDDVTFYDAMEDLNGTFVKFMLEKGAGLTKDIDYQVPTNVQSALVLAYDRYNDISRDAEIFQKNRPTVFHPGFLPNGDRIKILDA
jgi:prophage DNA circulation protein